MSGIAGVSQKFSVGRAGWCKTNSRLYCTKTLLCALLIKYSVRNITVMLACTCNIKQKELNKHWCFRSNPINCVKYCIYGMFIN